MEMTVCSRDWLSMLTVNVADVSISLNCFGDFMHQPPSSICTAVHGFLSARHFANAGHELAAATKTGGNGRTIRFIPISDAGIIVDFFVLHHPYYIMTAGRGQIMNRFLPGHASRCYRHPLMQQCMAASST